MAPPILSSKGGTGAPPPCIRAWLENKAESAGSVVYSHKGNMSYARTPCPKFGHFSVNLNVFTGKIFLQKCLMNLQLWNCSSFRVVILFFVILEFLIRAEHPKAILSQKKNIQNVTYYYLGSLKSINIIFLLKIQTNENCFDIVFFLRKSTFKI